jgi:hypothetical protein
LAGARAPDLPARRDARLDGAQDRRRAVTLVCAAHPSVDAIARCVRCGVHLCERCRSLDGVRNLCSSCVDAPTAARSGSGFVAAVEVPSVQDARAAAISPRSPWLAAFLSLVPGLGQAYAGRVMRGGAAFAAALSLRFAPWMTPALAAFLYVFNLFDAYRLAQNRSEGHAQGRAPTRTDDTLFLVVGLGVVALSLLERGGLFSVPSRTLLPLCGVAAGLLVAHETRR